MNRCSKLLVSESAQPAPPEYAKMRGCGLTYHWERDCGTRSAQQRPAEITNRVHPHDRAHSRVIIDERTSTSSSRCRLLAVKRVVRVSPCIEGVERVAVIIVER